MKRHRLKRDHHISLLAPRDEIAERPSGSEAWRSFAEQSSRSEAEQGRAGGSAEGVAGKISA
jgi:hypothetical protein